MRKSPKPRTALTGSPAGDVIDWGSEKNARKMYGLASIRCRDRLDPSSSLVLRFATAARIARLRVLGAVRLPSELTEFREVPFQTLFGAREVWIKGNRVPQVLHALHSLTLTMQNHREVVMGLGQLRCALEHRAQTLFCAFVIPA